MDEHISLLDSKNAKEKSERNSLWQASFNFSNALLGRGCVGMAYVLHQAGVLLGLIIIMIVAILADFSSLMLVKCLRYTAGSSYSDVMQATFGRSGQVLLSVLQFLYPFIAMVSSDVIVGDNVTKVLRYYTSTAADGVSIRRTWIILLVSVALLFPLTLYKRIGKLSKISLLSLALTGAILVILSVRAFTLGPSIPITKDAWRLASSGAVEAFTVCTTAFMCHHSTFLLYHSLHQPNEEKWRQLTHASVLVSAVVQLLYAGVGYATFTEYVQGDLLENYCSWDHLMNVARILFCFTVVFTYPIDCLVARDVILNAFRGDGTDDDEGLAYDRKRILITLLLVLATCFTSFATDCLGIVLQFNGILTAIPLAFMLPAACYLRLEPSPVLSLNKLPALVLLVFASITVVSALSLTLIFWQENFSCSHGSEMFYCNTKTMNANSTTTGVS